MGKNRWEINSSFKVTAADIIKAYSPPLWGHTHGHSPSSDAHTLDLWTAVKHLVVWQEHSMFCTKLHSSQCRKRRFCFCPVPKELFFFFHISQTKDFCSFLRSGFSAQYESIRFQSGSDRARGKLFSIVHLSIHHSLSVCADIYLCMMTATFLLCIFCTYLLLIVLQVKTSSGWRLSN